MCLVCAILENRSGILASINDYIRKADDDIANTLQGEGFAEPELSVSAASDAEEAITDILSDQSGHIAEAMAGYVSLDAFLEDIEEHGIEAVVPDDTAARLEGCIRDLMDELLRTSADRYIRELEPDLVCDAIRRSTAAWMDRWAQELADLMQLSSKDELREIIERGINEGKGVPAVARDIQAAGIRREAFRARRVALTEMLRVHSVAREEAIQQSPATDQKEWRHTGAHKIQPRENHVRMNGQIVAKDKPFKLIGRNGSTYYPMYPRDPILPAAESVNCHCIHRGITNDDVLGMSYAERKKFQEEIIRNDDEAWKEAKDGENNAKAGINEETIEFDWLAAKSRSDQIKYLGGGHAGKARLALIDTGIIQDDEGLAKLFKRDAKGRRVRKTFTELQADGIFTVRKHILTHSDLGNYKGMSKNYPNGRLEKGGHGQRCLDELGRRGIQPHIVKTYSNGVQIGYVDGHVSKYKNGIVTEKIPNADIGQSWFPEGWTEDDIVRAGTYIANQPGEPVGMTKFGDWNGVRVGIYVDASGSPATIFPHNMYQPNGDETEVAK